MKPEKIDYERMGNNFIVDDGGINRALIKVFAQIYIVNRHGVYKRYLSRSAAINKLAQVMATYVYQRLGLPIREDDVYDTERKAWIRGDLLHDYIHCRERAVHHIRRLLAKQRKIDKWNKEYQRWVETRDELYKRKPY
ncbi:hypothetical protein ACMVCI_003531 [Yersinia enterocolitica]|uniref:Uncharacterized protein n=1 Tax=Yersinia pekkanenii TaxID=1288385 RepID=A0A0T9RQ86_9GAMM|nr:MULTISPECIES: hypothetical protein [Yersinia]EKN4075476.1 hypothetical protein [Yersinia enterocolitica]EKN4145231.1 hypothetical protein [Yersinia enterocolitica]MCB5320231.1 hypothetical protein [Yersinia massiliensis]CNI76874.1 Uncharacterised protein [Yersinia pekkanenii]CQH54833.1 Uncharacterised protein [Yersinia frederiksenii]